MAGAGLTYERALRAVRARAEGQIFPRDEDTLIHPRLPSSSASWRLRAGRRPSEETCAYAEGPPAQEAGLPLHAAVCAWRELREEAELVAERHAAALNSAADRYGCLALHHCAYSNARAEAARWLLARGADVDGRSASRRTPLHESVESGCGPSGPSPARARRAARPEPEPERAARRTAQDAGGGAGAAGGGADAAAADEGGKQPLHLACHGDAPELVGALLDAGADARAADADGATPLHFAAYARQKPRNREAQAAILAILTKRGQMARADFARCTASGASPLGAAVRLELVPLVEQMLAAGADPNDGEAGGEARPHLYAALKGWQGFGNVRMARALVAAGADCSLTVPGEEAPLAIAMGVGRRPRQDGGEDGRDSWRALVAEMIDRGAPVSGRTLDGVPLLVLACSHGMGPAVLRRMLERGADANEGDRRGVMRLLLDAGADPNARTDAAYYAMGGAAGGAPRVPLVFACAARGTAEGVRLLLARGAGAGAVDHEGSSLLHLAIANGWEEVAELVLGAGVPVDAGDGKGRTALAAACARRSRPHFAGADPNVADGEGATPFLLCAEAGYLELAELVLGAGARPDAVDGRGRGFFHFMARFRRVLNESDIEVFAAAGAPHDLRDKSGSTPLLIACDTRAYALANWLYRKGADVNARNEEGDTPFLESLEGSFNSTMDNLEVLMIKEGRADPHATAPDGRSALHLALAKENLAASGALVARGADPLRTSGRDGETPLALAASRGYLPLVEAMCKSVAASGRSSEIDGRLAGGATALLAAVRAGHRGVAQTLHAHGASAAVADEEGETPVLSATRTAARHAREARESEVVDARAAAHGDQFHGFHAPQPLVARRSTLDHVEPESAPVAARQPRLAPLPRSVSAATSKEWAEAKRFEELAAWLVKGARAPLAAQDADGNTALHLAVGGGLVDLAKAMLVAAADPMITNKARPPAASRPL
eukprot:tig00000459_g1125.t1